MKEECTVNTQTTGPATNSASAPLDVLPRHVRAGSIVPRGDILQSNNNWTPNWAPALRIEFYPAAGTKSRFDYYTGSAVVPMTGTMSDSVVTWQAGDLGIKGMLEVHGIDRYTSVRRNNQTLAAANFQYNANTRVMTIPLTGATTVVIRRRARIRFRAVFANRYGEQAPGNSRTPGTQRTSRTCIRLFKNTLLSITPSGEWIERALSAYVQLRSRHANTGSEMKKTATVIALAFLIVGWGSDGNRTAAQARNTPPPPPVKASGPLGGYQPVSDVGQHARMPADVCDINTLLDAESIDFTTIDAIYRSGRHSKEGDGSMRTLGNFARAPRSTENLLGRYERQMGTGWLDVFASAAIRGTGAFAAEADLVRRQGVQKAARDQVLVAWTFHELDTAVDKASRNDFADDTGAPHNWDEARAYYHGQKPACAPYATADERGREFGTASAVNDGILSAMKRGLSALQARNSSGAAQARDEVVRQITITYIQSAIKYSAMVDAALIQGKAKDARVFQAEGWAYFRVIEPLIAEVNSNAARVVSSIFSLTSQPARGSGDKVARALVEAYDALRIRRSEVGLYRPVPIN